MTIVSVEFLDDRMRVHLDEGEPLEILNGHASWLDGSEAATTVVVTGELVSWPQLDRTFQTLEQLVALDSYRTTTEVEVEEPQGPFV